MRLGGVIFASLGILITVLVANGRWSSVWAAMLNDTGNAWTGGGDSWGTGSSGDAGLGMNATANLPSTDGSW